ncbi:class I SAM-dependent methyltransferase [Shewanella sp.]|uniref:class I SAM-dependent methyltransferase n=1 Tax=Shewanella sp. TaxID=50422 RepID=UPI004047C706
MYKLDDDGLYIPTKQIKHRNDEYDESAFNTLLHMQSKHFWYIGRHKFILEILKRYEKKQNFSAIDLGGGCGGWIDYLKKNMPDRLNKIALADSSRVALLNAKRVIGSDVEAYQVDLMELDLQEQWDVIFLLDVIEHCQDDVGIVREATKALKPGGKIIITTPALDFFWSHNDEYAKHLRRYNKNKYTAIANHTNLKLIDARYFMFFLSPLLWFSRKTKSTKLSDEEKLKAIEKEHQVPSFILNNILAAVFKAETPIGHMLPFPWGTSIIGVFQKY